MCCFLKLSLSQVSYPKSFMWIKIEFIRCAASMLSGISWWKKKSPTINLQLINRSSLPQLLINISSSLFDRSKKCPYLDTLKRLLKLRFSEKVCIQNSVHIYATFYQNEFNVGIQLTYMHTYFFPLVYSFIPIYTHQLFVVL